MRNYIVVSITRTGAYPWSRHFTARAAFREADRRNALARGIGAERVVRYEARKKETTR